MSRGATAAAQVSESVKLQSQTSSLMRAMDAFNEAIMLVDMDPQRWTIMFTNDAWLHTMSAQSPPAGKHIPWKRLHGTANCCLETLSS